MKNAIYPKTSLALSKLFDALGYAALAKDVLKKRNSNIENLQRYARALVKTLHLGRTNKLSYVNFSAEKTAEIEALEKVYEQKIERIIVLLKKIELI